MKAVVIYSSLTGNTKKIAEAIQAGIVSAGAECDCVRMKDTSPHQLRQYDLIGIGSFTKGAEPPDVAEFASNLRFVGGKHAFAFHTHGASPGKYFPSLMPKLQAAGMTVIGIGDWYGDVNIYHSPKPYPTDGHPDATDLAEAEAFGAEMVDVSRRLSAGEEVALPGVPMMPPPPPRDPELMPPVFPTPIKACVEYDREKCLYPKCTLCMDNCPVDGIDVTVEPAVYMNPCFECEVCLMLCPTGAVHADEFMEYYTPGTSMGGVLKKVFLPWLENEETQGRFRRHVEVEDIGWETPLSLTMRGKHPQFIIGKGFVKSDSSGPASE